MKAVVCKEFGPPEKLVIEAVEDPVPGAGEVLVEVRSAALTYPDVLIIDNKYQYKVKPPFIPGGEVAGIVQAIGEGVEGVSVGDKVTAFGSPVGGFAELSVVDAKEIHPLPEKLDFSEATGFGYAYGTGYYGLKYRGDLKAGETLLVLGAAGSVGLAAIELGKIMGARVIAAASTAEKLALAKERGADELINYNEEDLKSRVKELTDDGADVVYDAVGGEQAEAALRATAWRGRFLVIGFTAGIPRIPLNLTLLKGCQILGVFYGASRTKEPDIAAAVDRELDEFVAAGKLRPLVSRRCSLDEVPAALRDVLDRRIVGKVVVEP